MKLKKGDNVIVLSGNDKGKTGEVLSVITKSEKVIVKGINVRKKHVKAAPNREGGIVASEFPIHSSIVNVVCPKCGKPLLRKSGKQGKNDFYACSGFPKCRYIQAIKEEK